MIKLIASDLDGTLLDDKKRLPKDFFEVLDELNERGIHFAVSSGRTFGAVGHLFPEGYREKMDFICDNGACLLLGGKLKKVYALERGVFEALIAACEEIGDMRILVCAESGTYHLSYDSEFDAEVAKFYKNHIITTDLRSIDETIYKIAVCDRRGTMEHGKPALDGIFGDKLNVQASGEVWMDVMASGINKGAALTGLRETLGIAREETMAFGDYFNDVEMLNAAGWSFCMENGHEDVKKLCRYVAESNNNSGVTKAIRKYALGEVTV